MKVHTVSSGGLSSNLVWSPTRVVKMEPKSDTNKQMRKAFAHMHATATTQLLCKLVILTSRSNAIIHTWCQRMVDTLKVNSCT